MARITSMLAAEAPGRRVTIGMTPMAEIRALSRQNRLRCPACGERLVLRAGAILAAHFAHLPGSRCSHPDAEPETEAHRTGKALLAAWLAEALPESEIVLEAPIAETGQRADVLIHHNDGRIALEFQCADLSALNWLRRHHLYRAAGIRDLWILGADRLGPETRAARTEPEQTLVRTGAPLLYLDPLGTRFQAGSIARLPHKSERHPVRVRLLCGSPFPFQLLDWPRRAPLDSPPPSRRVAAPNAASPDAARLAAWLAARFHVLQDEIHAFFGSPLPGSGAIACAPALWQAAIYYQFVHGQVGRLWRLEDVDLWVRRYVPLARAGGAEVRQALRAYQDLLSAAGLLSLPFGRSSARVEADFESMGGLPDLAEAQRLARYRLTLARERER